MPLCKGIPQHSSIMLLALSIWWDNGLWDHLPWALGAIQMINFLLSRIPVKFLKKKLFNNFFDLKKRMKWHDFSKAYEVLSLVSHVSCHDKMFAITIWMMRYITCKISAVQPSIAHALSHESSTGNLVYIWYILLVLSLISCGLHPKVFVLSSIWVTLIGPSQN
jgi:hypothetical protein